MEWISVNDRLPEQGKLVLSADMSIYPEWLEDDNRYGFVKLDENNDFIYYDAGCDEWEIDENVTDWASLELPK